MLCSNWLISNKKNQEKTWNWCPNEQTWLFSEQSTSYACRTILGRGVGLNRLGLKTAKNMTLYLQNFYCNHYLHQSYHFMTTSWVMSCFILRKFVIDSVTYVHRHMFCVVWKTVLSSSVCIYFKCKEIPSIKCIIYFKIYFYIYLYRNRAASLFIIQ